MWSLTMDNPRQMPVTIPIIVRNIPPYDPTADTSEKAYLLDEIIPKNIRSHLLEILGHSESGEFSSKGYGKFVSNRVHKLENLHVSNYSFRDAFSFYPFVHFQFSCAPVYQHVSDNKFNFIKLKKMEWSYPSLDPMQVGAMCTGLSFLKKMENHIIVWKYLSM
jgi:hypothetical protein